MQQRKPVYLAGMGHCSARGLSPASAAAAMLAGQASHGWRQTGGGRYPCFRMPLQGAWLQRAEAAMRACAADMRQRLPRAAWQQLPVFFASSSFQVGLYEAPNSGNQGQLDRPAAVPTAPAVFAVAATAVHEAAGHGAAVHAASQTAPGMDAPAPRLPPGAGSFALQCMQWLGLQGVPRCFSHACTSSMLALDAAASWLAHGRARHALVLAIEYDNQLTANGFHSLGLLSPDACRPLAANRSGFVLGEAVAGVLLTTDHALAGNAGWRLSAWASATDAYSLTGPDPGGQPIAAVLQASLRQAGLRAADIGLVKLHAAGVGATDAAEARALQRVFGARMPPLLSLKPYLGHALGASTLVEITALLACLEQGQIPATLGCEEPDAELGVLPVQTRQPCTPRHVLCISLGFGGSITAAIISRGNA